VVYVSLVGGMGSIMQWLASCRCTAIGPGMLQGRQVLGVLRHDSIMLTAGASSLLAAQHVSVDCVRLRMHGLKRLWSGGGCCLLPRWYSAVDGFRLRSAAAAATFAGTERTDSDALVSSSW
jgi:hypothetical protein